MAPRAGTGSQLHNNSATPRTTKKSHTWATLRHTSHILKILALRQAASASLTSAIAINFPAPACATIRRKRFVYSLLITMLLSGCMGNRLADVRATEPRLIGNFHTPYDQLAACTKRRHETDSWSFGQPHVQLTHEKAHTLIHVYATHARSTLFDVTFQRLPSGLTLVEYRRSYDGYGSQEHTWAIINQCAQISQTPSLFQDRS
jgi:hypothetical protein